MYVQRQLASTVREALEMFPAVLITGPRQSGKTTLVKQEFGQRFAYCTFDDVLQRSFAREDPVGFLNQFGDKPLILDEFQYVPGILTALKQRIDDNREEVGHWILTGSQRFGMMKDVSESLAGRLAILELMPFCTSEEGTKGPRSLGDWLWGGGYPEPALHPRRRTMWVKAYLETYLERDVRQLTRVQDLALFEAFVALLASLHGQELNMQAISRRLGISKPTVKAWIGILESSIVVVLLRPYFANLGKRLIKSPKVYFLDPLLVSYLTRQPSPEGALAGAMGGALVEGLVVSEAFKGFANAGQRVDANFWRSHDGLEVDLLLQLRRGLVPVEIKATATPMPRHCRPLERFKRLVGLSSGDQGLLVCNVETPTPLPHGNLAMPWNHFGSWLRQELDS